MSESACVTNDEVVAEPRASNEEAFFTDNVLRYLRRDFPVIQAMLPAAEALAAEMKRLRCYPNAAVLDHEGVPWPPMRRDEIPCIRAWLDAQPAFAVARKYDYPALFDPEGFLRHNELDFALATIPLTPELEALSTEYERADNAGRRNDADDVMRRYLRVAERVFVAHHPPK